MKKWIILFGVFLVLLSSQSINFSQTKETIDGTNLDKGIIEITYKATDKAKYKVLVTKGDKKISYPYTADGRTDAFPLQLGNGTYKVGLLKNVSGTKYVYTAQKTVELKLEDPNIVFLNSVQNVNWEDDYEAIDFGATLLKTNKTNDLKIKTLYGYLIKNMAYDYDKISTLTTDYIPDIELTYQEMMGICYDYSAIFASIERYHGIPTKLVKGYTKYVDGYHAWNEIFIDGKWVIIDNTVDATWKGSKTTIKMIKDPKFYTKVNEY